MFSERQTKFTTTRSAARLKLLQRTTGKLFESNGVPKNINKLVIVPGPDGKYNKLSQNAIVYLLDGSYGRELDNSTIESESLEDTILCIGESSVDFYHNADLPVKESRITAKWPNKKQYRPNEEIVDDAEECELFKIKSFIQMVRGEETLGFPAKKNGDNSSNSVVESWPLAQAYGLDEMKTGGFLTMKHNVIDVTPGLNALFSHIDAHAMDRILSESVDRLCFHWNNSMGMLDRVKLPSRRRRLSEADAGEPLSTFYEFGQLRLQSQGGDNSVTGRERQPIILFGKRTNSVSQNPPNTGEKQFYGFDESCTIQNSGINGRPALHMIVEGVDPATGVSVARSYFLNNGIKPMEIVDPDALVDRAYEEDERYDGEKESDEEKKAQIKLLEIERNDVQLLARLYNALVNGLKATCTFSDGSVITATQAKEHFMSVASSSLSKFLPENFDFSNDLQVSVNQFDASGRPFNSKNTMETFDTRSLIYIRVQLMNIPSSNGSSTIGSLILGDTITCAKQGSNIFVVTQRVPYVQSWYTSSEDIQCEKQVSKMLVDFHARESVTNIGDSISDGVISRVSILLGGSFDPYNLVGTLKNCDVQFFEHGVSIKHKGYGTVVYSWASDISSVKILHQQPSSSEKASLMVIGVKNDARKFGFANLMDENKFEREIAIVLPEYDEIREAALMAMGIWQDQQKKDENVDVGVVFATQAGVAKHIGVLENAYNTYVSDWGQLCKTFISNCLKVDMNNMPTGELEKKTSPSKVTSKSRATGTKSDSNADSQTQVPVTIITGVPGSGKRELAEAIIKYSGETVSWKYYLSKDESATIQDVETWLEESVGGFDLNTIGNGREGRVLIVTPGLTTTKEIVHAIVKLNSRVGYNKIFVGSSVSCVNVGNTYHDISQSQFTPGIIEMCSAGWTSHIAMIGCGAVKKNVVEELRSYLREVNQKAEFLRISGGGMKVNAEHIAHDLVLNQNEISSLLSSSSFHSDILVEERRVTPQATIDKNDTQIRGFTVYPSFFKNRFVQFLQKITSPTSQLSSTNTGISDENVTDENSNAGASSTGGGNIFRQMQLAAKKKVLGSNSNGTTDDGMNRGADRSVYVPRNFKCYSVNGHIRFVEVPGEMFKFSAVNGKVWFKNFDMDDMFKGNKFVFHGENVKGLVKTLKKGLMSCAYQVPRNISLRTRQMVTDAEMQAIKREHIHDGVIDGYYFDGTFYTDPTGDKREFPPNMEDLIKDFLSVENEKIQKVNETYESRRKDMKRILSGMKEENIDDLILASKEEFEFLNNNNKISY
jgi:hypothetical protein